MLVRTVSLCASACLLSTTLLAANNSMSGTWKLDQSKSSFSGLQEKIENLGGNKYKFSFGNQVETVAFDGKEYPTSDGFMWSVTPTGPNSWKSVHSKNGKVTSTAEWTVTDNGRMFVSQSHGTRADGSASGEVFKAKRVAGSGSGLAGTWQSIEMKLNSPSDVVIQEGNGNSFEMSFPADKEKIKMKLDGKAYPDKGPRVAPDSTISGKRIDAQTVELTGHSKGKLIYTEHLQLSRDGDTLTSTLHFAGEKKPEVDVYRRS